MAKLKDGFYKQTAEAVGSNSYMLLAGGGSKALSDFATASEVVTALGTNGNYVTWTKNGTANNLTVPYATKTKYWNFNEIGSLDFNAMYGDTYRGTAWYGGGSNSAINNPLGDGEAFGMQIWRNASGYTTQLIMTSEGRLTSRYWQGSTWSSLKTFAYTSDIPTVTNYYWANIKISSSSNSATKPTFATATATTSVTTPLVTNNGVLTLNGTSGIYLKYNNSSINSVVLNGTAFKPFDDATGKLSLGTSSARWSALYSGIGNFTGDVTLLSSTGDSPKLYFVRGGSIGDSGALWDWRMYSSSGHFYLQSDQGTGTWSTQLFINANNNVGIGTVSPTQKLHVNGLVNITANSGTLTIGCQNTSYTHYSTTGGTHWFNKAVEVNGNLTPHANTSFNLGSSSKRWSTVYGAIGNFSTRLEINSGGDAKIILNNTDTETKYQFISFRQEGTEYGYLGTLGDDVLKWSGNTILHSGNSSVSKSGQTLTVKINGVEQSLTNTTYTSLKNPNAIKFKNTAGTTVTYDGSSAVDLTDGVNYASSSNTASQLNNTSVSNPASAASGQYTKWYSQISQSSGYAGNNYGFPVSNNANGILWMGTHSGPYGGQLGISSNRRIYYRFISNNSFPTTANGGSWNKVAWVSDITKSQVGLGNVQNTAFYKRVVTVNGSGWDMAGTNSNAAFTIYAPITAGTSGQVLTSTGGTPGWTNQSSLSVGYSKYLKILDVRDTNHLPNSTTYPEKNITAWFNSTGTPDSNWWSGITVKGWTNTYAVWQLCSYSSTGTDNNYRLYHRNGINNTWGSWKTIAYTSDIPTIGNGTVTIKQGGTNKGSFTMNQSGNTTIELTDNNSDTKVTQTVTSSNATYPLLLAPSGQTATTTTTSYFDSGVTLNPSTNTITANITGSAGSVAWANVTGKPTIPTVTNYYWANVNISSSSNSATTPTFSTITTTGTSYVATLRPSTTETHFLGSSAYRWNGVFSTTGNFSGRITSSVAVGTAPFNITSTTVNANLNADMVDGKHASDFAPASHSHSYLPLSGGTISNTSYGPLTIERKDSANMAAIKFKNNNGDLGSIGMNAVNGNLIIYNAATSASRTILDSGNSSVSGGGSSWGSSITVKINDTTKTLTIPSNPNTWRGITDSYSGTDSTISLSQKGGNALYNALVNGYAASAGNAETVDTYHIWAGTRAEYNSTSGNANTIYFVTD